MSESKDEVFEALLVEHLNGIVFGGQIDDEKGWIVRWRERYAKAEGIPKSNENWKVVEFESVEKLLEDLNSPAEGQEE